MQYQFLVTYYVLEQIQYYVTRLHSYGSENDQFKVSN